jgi:hypothetical protein
MRSFEALFKVVSTQFGLRIVENSIETPHFIFCSSFQNLRLGGVKFGQTFQSAFPWEALFKGVSTGFGRPNVEKCFPGKRTLKCLSDLPKSSFGEHKFMSDYRRVNELRIEKADGHIK